jgi:hypothetical protein
MIFKNDRFKGMLSVGALALMTTTLALGIPKAQARVDVGIDLGVPPIVAAPPAVLAAPATVMPPVVLAAPPVMAAPTVVTPYTFAVPPVVGGVNLGFGIGQDGRRGDRGRKRR